MTKTLFRLFLGLAALLIHQELLANGGMWDNPHRSAGNALMPSKRFALQREELEIKLGAVDYEVKVTYFVTDAGNVSNSAQQMYFPVVCSRLDSQDYPDKCSESFRVEANGQPLPSKPLLPNDLKKIKSLWVEAQRLNQRLQKLNISSDEVGGPQNIFYLTDLPQTTVKTLTIYYKAGYAQEMSGTSKSAGTYYGKARMVYDFSPAAAWSNGLAELQIKVDTAKMQSPLLFDEKRWPFVVKGNVATLTLRQPDFAKLPTLQLATEVV